jgi:hypothetical protein
MSNINHRQALRAITMVALIIALGYMGHQDATVNQIEAMQDSCQSHMPDCQSKIAVVQAQGFEVLSKDGQFWAEGIK